MNPPRKCFKGCKYHAIPFSGYTCEYMLTLGRRRPCPADACTAYEIGKRNTVAVRPKLSPAKPKAERKRRSPSPAFEIVSATIREHGYKDGVMIAAQKLGKGPQYIRTWLAHHGITGTALKGGAQGDSPRPSDNP